MPIDPVLGSLGNSLLGGVAGLIGANVQAKNNMKLAQFQAQANERYLAQQLEYNSPKNQMLRFQQAGLNPNLIYGQGNPGSQSAPLSYPEIKPADYQRAVAGFTQLMPTINQTKLVESQVQAQNAKTIHTYAMVELNKLQQRLIEKNPLLDNDGFRAIIDGLKSTAALKLSQSEITGQQAKWATQFVEETTPDGWRKGQQGMFKLDAELKLLEQRFNLGTQDQAIKSQVLQSKEFQNAILEVQKKFMTDFDVTPQHVLQFVQLLLMKLL